MRNLWKRFFLAGIVFLSSCYEDNLSRWADSDLELIKEARNYFEETITEAVIQGTLVKEGSYSPGEVVPEWKEAHIKKDGDFEYVFVPLFTQKMYFGRFKRVKKSGEYFAKVQVSQILCIRRNVEGELSASYLTLIPTFEYHNKNKQKTVTQFIKSPEFYSNFTGGVLYNDIVSFRLFAVDKVEKGKTDWGFSRANTPDNKKFNELCSRIFENVYLYGGIYTRGGGDDTVPGGELEEVVVIWCTKCQQQVEEGHECNGNWWEDKDEDDKNPGGQNPDDPDPFNPNPGSPDPGGPIGGGGGGGSPKPGTGDENNNNNENNNIKTKINHKITIPNSLDLKTQRMDTKQCVAYSMYYALKCMGENAILKDMINVFKNQFNINFNETGVKISQLNTYLDGNFKTHEFVSYENAVDNGYLMILNINASYEKQYEYGNEIRTQTLYVPHAVLLVGYNSDGTLVILDSYTGETRTINRSEIRNNPPKSYPHSKPFSTRK